MRRAGGSTRTQRSVGLGLGLGLCLAQLCVPLPGVSSNASASSMRACERLSPAAVSAACQAVGQAQTLQARGQSEEALARLPSSSSLPPIVTPAVEAMRAELLLQTGRMQEALPAIRALDDGGVLAGFPSRLRSLRLELARAHVAAREFALAISLLQQIVAQEGRGGLDVEARALLATTLLSEGSKGRALPHVVKLLVDAPAHPLVVPLESYLDDGSVRLNEQQSLKRWNHLLRSARFERLVAETREVSVPQRSRSDANVQRQTLRVTALSRSERHEEAVALAKTLVADPKAPGEWRRVHAWSLGKDGRLLEAGEAWRAISTDPGDRALATEACFFSGFLPYEAGLYALARQRLQACRDMLRGTSWEEQAGWYEALSWLLEGKDNEALPLLEKLVASSPSSKEADKYRYWLARVQESAGLQEHAIESLVRVTEQDPTSWYGLLARKRLSSKPVQGVVVSRDAFAQGAATDAAAEQVRTLHAFGFGHAARELASLRGASQSSLALSQAIEDAHRTWRYGARYRPTPAVRESKVNASGGWRASYPEPYADLVMSASVRHGIEPALTWAIMRTESGFSPVARSPVGAIGLMQLMPYTATGVAAVLGLPAPSVTELQNPETNIELGTGALGLWLRQLGHPLLVVASYNGGPGNVVQWLRSFGHLPPDLFVERIPFLETRDYVKKVLPTLALYRALQGDVLELSLPNAAFGAPAGEVTVFAPVPP